MHRWIQTVCGEFDGIGLEIFSLHDLGETLSFECLIYSLFEFVQVLMDLSTYKNSVKTSMEELCYYLILCMQITEEEVKREHLE